MTIGSVELDRKAGSNFARKDESECRILLRLKSRLRKDRSTDLDETSEDEDAEKAEAGEAGSWRM